VESKLGGQSDFLGFVPPYNRKRGNANYHRRSGRRLPWVRLRRYGALA